MDKKQKGFSLIEMMIAMGVISALLVSITKVMEVSEVSMQKVSSNRHINQKVTALKFHLWNNKENCDQVIDLSSGTPVLKSSTTINLTHRPNFLSINDNSEYKKQGFRVDAIEIKKDFFNDENFELNITFYNIKKSRIELKKIPLIIQYNSLNGTTYCTSIQDEFIASLKNIVALEACRGLGQIIDTYDTTLTPNNRWSPKCINSATEVANDLSFTCPDYSYLKGIKLVDDVSNWGKMKISPICSDPVIQCSSNQFGIIDGTSIIPSCINNCSVGEVGIISNSGILCVKLECSSSSDVEYISAIKNDGSVECRKLLVGVSSSKCNKGQTYLNISSSNELTVNCAD